MKTKLQKKMEQEKLKRKLYGPKGREISLTQRMEIEKTVEMLRDLAAELDVCLTGGESPQFFSGWASTLREQATKLAKVSGLES